MKREKLKEQEAEYYFIQFIYCSNPYLLQREFRPLYDTMLDKYIPVYLEGKKYNVDLFEINKKYKNSL